MQNDRRSSRNERTGSVRVTGLFLLASKCGERTGETIGVGQSRFLLRRRFRFSERSEKNLLFIRFRPERVFYPRFELLPFGSSLDFRFVVVVVLVCVDVD